MQVSILQVLRQRLKELRRLAIDLAACNTGRNTVAQAVKATEQWAQALHDGDESVEVERHFGKDVKGGSGSCGERGFEHVVYFGFCRGVIDTG